MAGEHQQKTDYHKCKRKRGADCGQNTGPKCEFVATSKRHVKQSARHNETERQKGETDQDSHAAVAIDELFV